jgi:hypothetical protein
VKAEELLQEFERYYDMTYGKGAQEYIFKYLRRFDELYLDALLDTTILRHSSQYKKLPDIAVFEEFQEEATAGYRLLKNRRTAEDLRGVKQISEDDIDIRAMADERGIDTHKDGWLARLFLDGLSKGGADNS